MSKSDPYCQFPLCALLLPYDGQGLGELVRHYSAVRVGHVFKHKWDKRLDEKPLHPDWQDRLDPFRDLGDEDQEALAICLALVDPKCHVASAVETVEDYYTLDNWHEDFESAYGPDVWVRVRYDLVEDLTAGRLDAREFRFVCAINAILGRKPRAAITFDRIRHAASGFRSAAICEEWALAPIRDYSPRILSIDQVKRLRRKLEPRGLFYSVHDGRRRHYSIRVKSHQELAELVEKAKPMRDRTAEQRKAEEWLRLRRKSAQPT